jgi:hypothetical protein
MHGWPRGASLPWCGRAGGILGALQQEPHVLGGAQHVDALACQAAQQQHAAIARTRQVGEIQDEGPAGTVTGITQEGHSLFPKPANDPDGREIWRFGDDQAENHVASSSPGANATKSSVMALGST